MDEIRLVYQIEAEAHFTSAMRVIGLFNRNRIPILEMHTMQVEARQLQEFRITVKDNPENARKVLKKLVKEVDVLSATITAATDKIQ